MKKIITIGIIFGGRSFEHEVSLVSARSVINNLDKKKFRPVLIAISKKGNFYLGDKARKILQGIKIKEKKLNPKTIIDLVKKRIDVYFPVLHGIYGEDGTIQGLLELLNKPYVGAGVLASACGMDKIIQKQLFLENNLPVVDFIWFLKSEWKKNKKNILKKIEEKIQYPCFIKPSNAGSSIGITKANDQKELIKGINLALNYDRKVLIEKAINQVREIEISVLGNDKPIASLAGEIVPSNEFYDYEAKYVDGKSKLIIPAKLNKEINKKIRQIAIKAYRVIDCSGFARVDFLMNKITGEIYLNEINTIPGFTSISMYPKLWQATGLSYKNLIERLIKLAINRYKEKNSLKTSFETKSKWYAQ